VLSLELFTIIVKSPMNFFCTVDHWNDSNYVHVFDERVGPKNTDNTVSLVSNYLFHSGLVPQGVKCVCLFLDNATLMNKNRYSLGGLGSWFSTNIWITCEYLV